ncbi:hypothetical protein Tco_1181377, partial [Tanacetum coccineum]
YNHKKSQGFVKNEDQVSGSGANSYDNADVMMAMSVEELLDWIMDSGGSYHITYRRDYLVDFEEYDGGNILLGDGRECRVWGTGTLEKEGFTMKMQSGKIRVIKGSLVILSGTRKANCVYTLDGQAMTRKTLKGTGSVKELQGVELEVEPQEDHTFEVEPHGNVDHVVGSHEVQTQDLIYYHLARDFHVEAGLKDDMDAQLDVYVLSNDEMGFSCGCKAEIWATKVLLDKAKGNILGMEIVRDQNGNTLRVSQSRFYNGKLVQTLLEGHSIPSLKGSLSGDCDVEKNGKRTCFVDSDYAMGRSITRYGFMIQGCAGSWKAYVQHMKALSTTEAAFMTLTEAAKEAIWLKGLAIESGFELKIVAGIAAGTLSKDIPSPRFQHWLKLLSIGEG